MAAEVRSSSGLVLGAGEAVEHEAALDLGTGSANRSSTTATTMSSGTSSPRSMYSLAFEPGRHAGVGGVAEELARREVLDPVVLGEPRRLGALAGALLAEEHQAGSATHDASSSIPSGEEALVVAHHQLAVDLLHRLERDAHGDQQRGAAERELR